MEIPVYLLLNLMIIFTCVRIIRWRRVLSFEGLGLVFLLSIILIDFLELTIYPIYSDSNTEFIRLINSRIVPSLVVFVGLLSLSLGLFISNPNPNTVEKKLNIDELLYIKKAAIFIFVLGLSMKIFAIVSAGYYSILTYLLNLGSYRSLQGKYGGFLDNGTGIAIFGLCLYSATLGTHMKKQILIVLSMVFVSFIFSFSRSDFISVLLQFIIVSAVFNKPFIQLIKSRKRYLSLIIPAIILFSIISSGFKAQFRTISGDSSLSDIHYTYDDLVNRTYQVVLTRYGKEGVYGNYSNFVNRIYENENSFFNGEVLRYATTAWIPYVINKDKQQHPFRDIGRLVYDDYHTSFYDVSATTLIGSAFADFGIYSVILYLFFYGIIIGVIRKYLISYPSMKIRSLIWYISFILLDGSSNFIHGGIINLFDAIALSTGLIICLFVFDRASQNVKKLKIRNG